MKNVIVYIAESGGISPAIRRNLDFQVENGLRLGWRPEDTLLYTNFPYGSGEVASIEVEPPPRPRTARVTSFYKTWCMLQALDQLAEDEVAWYHDVDAYQLRPVAELSDDRRLGFCLYTSRDRLLVQGGSLLVRKSARPVFEYVLDRLRNGCRKDEFALTEAVERPEFLDWFEVLDYSYNIGGSDFALRCQLATEPIRVVHFHLDLPEHLGIFVHGYNPLGLRLLDEPFLALAEKHGFDLAAPAASPTRRRRGIRPLVDSLRRHIARQTAS